MIRIKAKVDGFRRCGIRHRAEAVTYPYNVFTDEQIAILKAEPMLVVEIIDSETIDGDGTGTALPPIEQNGTNNHESDEAGNTGGTDTEVITDDKEAGNTEDAAAEPTPEPETPSRPTRARRKTT